MIAGYDMHVSVSGPPGLRRRKCSEPCTGGAQRCKPGPFTPPERGMFPATYFEPGLGSSGYRSGGWRGWTEEYPVDCGKSDEEV